MVSLAFLILGLNGLGNTLATQPPERRAPAGFNNRACRAGETTAEQLLATVRQNWGSEADVGLVGKTFCVEIPLPVLDEESGNGPQQQRSTGWYRSTNPQSFSHRISFVSYQWPTNAYWADDDLWGTAPRGLPVRRLQDWQPASGEGRLVLLEMGQGFGRGVFTARRGDNVWRTAEQWSVIIRGVITNDWRQAQMQNGYCEPNTSTCFLTVRFTRLSFVEKNENFLLREWDLTATGNDRTYRPTRRGNER